jgi:1-deoxy-D-xylulose-5-phosphate synthase
MIVAAPMNEQELRNMMYSASLEDVKGPYSIRYPRGAGVMVNWKTPFEKIETGKGRMINDGEEIAILSIGHHGNFAQEAVARLKEKGVYPAHFDMRFVKPLDEELLHSIFKRFTKIITVEDGCIMGGFGSAVLEFMADHGYNASVKRLGIPDEVIEHGTQKELYQLCGYDTAAICDAACEMAGVKINQ